MCFSFHRKKDAGPLPTFEKKKSSATSRLPELFDITSTIRRRPNGLASLKTSLLRTAAFYDSFTDEVLRALTKITVIELNKAFHRRLLAW